MSLDDQAWTPDALAAPHRLPDKAARIRRMFNRIAPRYELINSMFSAGRDAAWRRRAVDLACVGGNDVVLDVACGTGDFAKAFLAAHPRWVIGCDFAHEMLKRGASRTPGEPSCRFPRAARALYWSEADALQLPFRSGSFSITACAFGVRNFQDLDAGLAEMFRVLQPGGRAVILEFTRPASRVVRGVFELYSHHLMPLAATLVSGDRDGAYRYLPRSVVSFIDAAQMGARLRRAGFCRVSATPLTLGIVTVYLARRHGS